MATDDGIAASCIAGSGVAREVLGTVALTHTHEDHVNGLVAADGSDAFPNLDRLFVPQEEVLMFDEYGRLARYRQRRLPIGRWILQIDRGIHRHPGARS